MIAGASGVAVGGGTGVAVGATGVLVAGGVSGKRVGDRAGVAATLKGVGVLSAGAGLGAVFTPTGYGTPLAEGKETREIDGRHYVLEYPIKADFALIKAHQGDRWGNLVYRKAARNFGPIMATAAKTTIVEVSQLVSLGDLDPEHIITPGIFVQRLFSLENLTAAQRA